MCPYIFEGKGYNLSKIKIDRELIFLNAKYINKVQAIRDISREMHMRGYVRKSHADAVLEREQIFPTGIPEQGLGFAIPHADSEHIIESVIAIAVLDKPVKFNVMGSQDESSDVNFIFMLAIKKPEDHIKILGKIIGVLMSSEKADNLKMCKDKSQLADFLENEIIN